jgi:hypothetical protein
MRKTCKALALTLSMIMLFSTFTAAGDSGGKTILTLEEAKELALKDDTQYKVQQSYIEQKKEDYQDLLDKTMSTKGSSIVEKTAHYVSNKLLIDNAFYAWQLEIFKKNDIKRKSDYDVTIAYYNVMKAKYPLDDAKRAMDLAEKDLDIAKIKLEHDIITKTELSQFENAYKSAKTEYDTTFSQLEDTMESLSKEIGKTLDVNNDDVNMAIRMPDIASIDLVKIREDYLKNSTDFYSLNTSLSIAKYQKLLVEDKYEEYQDDKGRMSDSIEDGFADLIYEASVDYDNAQYKYDELVKALDISLNSQYTGIISTKETIENLKKTVENTRETFKNSKLKYDFGLIAEIELLKSESALKDLENTLNTTIVSLNSQYLTLTQYSYTPEKQ